MKKNLRTLTLAIVSVLAFSCSSDDSKTTSEGNEHEKKTKDLKVIDSSILTSFENEKAVNSLTTTYYYNTDGTIKNTEEIYKYYEGEGEVEREMVTYTYKNKLPFALKVETFFTNKTSENWELQYTYENNKIVKGDAINSDNDKTLYLFVYNSKGQLISTKRNDDTTPNGTTYKYDNNNNLVEINRNGIIELITYDDKKSPFTNMNITDQMYAIELFENYNKFLTRSPYNVTGTTFDFEPSTQKYHGKYVHTNSYDKEGYLESDSVENIDKKTKISEIKYNYKIITVPVK